MLEFGEKVGSLMQGGEVVELLGDVGAGKTTFTKGIALGLGVSDDVQSPTFTISRIYSARGGLELAHYDFYRLTDPGILKLEIEQAMHDDKVVTVIEWGGIVEGVLPHDRLAISFASPSETSRTVEVMAGGEKSEAILKGLAA